MIYHITTEGDWEGQETKTEFVPSDYQREGFVHCCMESQLAGVRERYFRGKHGLVLLHLDESKLKSTLRFEASTNSEKFPHLYGPINLEAVVKAERLA